MDTNDLTSAGMMNHAMGALFDAMTPTAPRYGKHATTFTDEFATDWRVTYDLDGPTLRATETDPAEYPIAIVRSVELGAVRIPLRNFGIAFIDVLQEHCQIDAMKALP